MQNILKLKYRWFFFIIKRASFYSIKNQIKSGIFTSIFNIRVYILKALFTLHATLCSSALSIFYKVCPALSSVMKINDRNMWKISMAIYRLLRVDLQYPSEIVRYPCLYIHLKTNTERFVFTKVIIVCFHCLMQKFYNRILYATRSKIN